MSKRNWHSNFDERQVRLIKNCREYARKNPDAGPHNMPGHNLALIVHRLVDMIDNLETLIVDLGHGSEGRPIKTPEDLFRKPDSLD